MKKKQQLFKIYPVLSTPDILIRTRDSFKIINQDVFNYPFMSWPNGKPCDPINCYLIDISEQTTGKSLRTYASQLTHLVRFCGLHNYNFEDLDDDKLFRLSEHLQDEHSQINKTERARSNNTIINIISKILHFLFWYQDTYMLPTLTPLIGEKKFSPRINVKIKTNKNRYGDKTYTHRSQPETNSVNQKKPMSINKIEKIEALIEQLADDQLEANTIAKHKVEYIRTRRRIMIWLMKRTGLRPSEMLIIPIHENLNIIKNKKLIIPIKKRRRRTEPVRKFPLTLYDSLMFHKYLLSRKKFVEKLKINNPNYVPPESLFLSPIGKSITQSAIEKDFERIVKPCNFPDKQACFSMFRHRFITYEVVTHLREFMNSTGKTKAFMTNTDYISILKRVASKTGHACTDSLWHYIDLAWEEMNIWGDIDKAIIRLHSSDKLFEDMLDFKRDFANAKDDLNKEKLDTLIAKISEILEIAHENILEQ